MPNGLVGDWRLPDEEFLETFTLPRPEEHPEFLAQQHPLPRDARIVFEEGRHLYFIDGDKRAPRSVTGLVHQFAETFDAPSVIVRMRSGRNWRAKRGDYLHPDGSELSNEEIAEKWSLNGRVQSARGTLMHYQIERFLNGARIAEPQSLEFRYFLRFREDFLVARGLEPLRTELSVFHCGLRVAGQLDMLARERGTGRVVILDWKRSKKIEFSNRFRKLAAPLGHLDDCNYSHYSLQLNVYRYILESEYELEVGGMYLGVFHPNEASPLCVEIPRLEREIELLLEHERAGPAQPGPQGVFVGATAEELAHH